MAKKAPAPKRAPQRKPSRSKRPDLAHIAEDLRPLATPISDLKPDSANARRHGPRNLQTIAASLKSFGQVKPIVTLADGTIIAGNGTVEAAKSLGWTHVAATRFANAEQARAFALADNRTAELAEWDVELLQSQLDELKGLDIDIGSIGFADADIEAIASPPENGQARASKAPVQHDDDDDTLSDEVFTPSDLFAQLSLVFDTDPASPIGGGDDVPATVKFTKEDDGLVQAWEGRVWLNPPYSAPAAWMEKFLEHGNGIALVCISKSNWFDTLWKSEAAIVLISHRFKFVKDGQPHSIFLPVVLVGLGEDCRAAISRVGQMR